MKMEVERERIALKRERMQAEINLQREKFQMEQNMEKERLQEKLYLQREKLQVEQNMEKERRQAEQERMQAEQKRLQDELQLKRLELEKMAALKKDELKILETKNTDKRKRMESTVYKAKLFSDALRGTMARMPSDPIELTPHFRTVEKLSVDFTVEKELKVHLLKPHLTEQTRALIARMDPDEASDYEEVKKLLLHECKFSPAALLEKFNSLQRNADETYALYGNRLMSVLTYYVDNRKVKTHEQLLQLLVCDRIKSTLSRAGLQHVLSLTACAVGTSCCISDVPSQWESRNFDPPQLPHFSTDLNET